MNTFEDIIQSYLSSSYKNEELEARFGTLRQPNIKRNDFERIISFLQTKGFQLKQEQYLLRVQPIKQEERLPRIEINGLKPIQEYCITNSILNEKTNKLKSSVYIVRKKYLSKPYDIHKFNVRISYQKEQVVRGELQSYIQQWNELLKYYRHLRRFTFTHPSYPQFRIDMSIVKQSSLNSKYKPIPRRTIQESNLFNNDPQYEIEIEAIHKNSSKEELLSSFKKLIQLVLSGWQNSLYPVTFDEIQDVKKNYSSLIYGDTRRLFSKHFIGYSSVSLEMKHLQPLTEDLSLRDKLKRHNLNNTYVFTDKADGERRLLYINRDGNMYTIDTNMNFHFTGVKSNKYKQTILDGEYISHDRKGEFIDLYMVFDIYYLNGIDIRGLPFAITENFFEVMKDDLIKLPFNNDISSYKDIKTRIKCLNEVVEDNTREGITAFVPFKMFMKHFDYSDGDTILYSQAIKNIFEKKDSGDLYPNLKLQNIIYENDGIIMTPMITGVGMDWIGQEVTNYKMTWSSSFKWKPPEFNTIDFLVFIKDKSINTTMVKGDIVKYQQCILNVGYDPKKHGYSNPYERMLKAQYKDLKSNVDEINDGYRPKPFYPIQPEDDKAHICNIPLIKGLMYTEDGKDTFENGTIVEFKYDNTREEGWRWIPIRVRHDKTYEFRNNEKNYGNAYHVAQSVWTSIHHPVTQHILLGKDSIPSIIEQDDVYYYGVSGKSQTISLRDFHNLYVKKELILRTIRTSRRNKSLVDIAVGKAGDLPKWIVSNVNFVLGLDVNKDNIYNRIDGACSRYLNYKTRNKNTPDCLFGVADSSKHILSGDACLDTNCNKIIQSLQQPVSERERIRDEIGDGVAQYTGFLNDKKFHVVSCQFAFHYFWGTHKDLHMCLRNVSELCEIDGYFIGTSYNGKRVFELLKNIKENEQVDKYKNGNKIWSIIKRYDHNSYVDDDTCIGYAIDVYQETIGQYFKEYLVNYEYLTEVIKMYGFELIPKEQLKKMYLSKSYESLNKMYNIMINKINVDKRKGIVKTLKETGKASRMSKEEKEISFLNNYFIFKKVRDVNAEEVMKSFLKGRTTIKKRDELNELPEKQSIKQFKEPPTPTVDEMASGEMES